MYNVRMDDFDTYCRWIGWWHRSGTSSASRVTPCQRSSGCRDACTPTTRRPSTWSLCPSATFYFCCCTLSRSDISTHTHTLRVGFLASIWLIPSLLTCCRFWHWLLLLWRRYSYHRHRRRGAGGTCPLPTQKKSGKYFSGNYHLKFGHFRANIT